MRSSHFRPSITQMRQAFHRFPIKNCSKNIIIASLSAPFAGIIASAGTALFAYMHRIPEYSVSSNFFYYFLKEYAFPMILVYALYFFTTKDSVEFRVKAFFPLIAAFYAIYMPYCVIASSNAAFSFFQLFVKPVLMLSEVFIASLFVYKIYCFVWKHVHFPVLLES